MINHLKLAKFEENSVMENIAKYARPVGIAVLVYLLVILLLIFVLDSEPDTFDVSQIARSNASADSEVVTGYVTASTLIKVMETVLNKRGGYLSNDIMPPGVVMDNIPNWEFGVITQVRDITRAFRNDFSRSQTQSVEDEDLKVADPQFHFDTESWILPASESEYKEGIDALHKYLVRLKDSHEQDAQFFARADNLRDWLAIVEKRLGSLAQRLSASVGQIRVNIDLQGDAAAEKSTATPRNMTVKTPWLQIDDIFYETRGSAWALIHFFKAVEIDFQQVLEKKNALVSLRQIIRELEATQESMWSPMILNGSGFGFVANHSLVMASYISSANAAIIDLKNLLQQG